MYEEWLKRFLDSGFGITSFDDPAMGANDGTGGGTAANPSADSAANPPAAAKPFATFNSQAELSDRLNQAKRSELVTLAKEAGFDDPEKFKEHLKQDKERRTREQGELVTLQTERQTLAQENTQLKSTLRNVSLRSAVESIATTLGFHDPNDAYSLSNWSDIEIAEEGTVDRDKIKTKLAEVAKNKPYLVKPDATAAAGQPNPAGGKPAGSGGGGTQRSNVANPQRPQPSGRAAQLTPEKEAEYRKRFPVLGSMVRE